MGRVALLKARQREHCLTIADRLVRRTERVIVSALVRARLKLDERRRTVDVSTLDWIERQKKIVSNGGFPNEAQATPEGLREFIIKERERHRVSP